jgi:hypothetical protein
MEMMHRTDDTLVQKWEPVLEGIDNDYTRRVTAQLLENQAKSIVEEKVNTLMKLSLLPPLQLVSLVPSKSSLSLSFVGFTRSF